MARQTRGWLYIFLFIWALVATSILVWNKRVCASSFANNNQTLTSDEPVGLIIPVAGVSASQLRDTYNEARAEGRTHNAIDIIAPRDTSVLAAADGEVVKLFYSERGGNTIYQMSKDKKFVFYYAHLASYAAGLKQGHKARQGEVMAYVGDTGNAGVGNYHLHFAIWLVTDPKRYWDGINLNPYPILRRAPEAAHPVLFPRTIKVEERL